MGKDDEARGDEVLVPDLLGGTDRPAHHGFAQVFELADRLAEAAGDRGGLQGLGFGIEVLADLSVEFAHQAFKDDGADIPGDRRRQGREIGRGVYTQWLQSGGHGAGDAPDFLDWPVGEHAGAQVFIVQVDDAAPDLFAGLGEGVGDLAEGPGGTKADTGGQADRSLHCIADKAGGGDIAESAGKRWQPEEGFVDRVDFDGVAELGDDRVEAPIEVGVELVVRGSQDDAVLADRVADLEDGSAHLDVERLGFLAAGHAAAIVVG